MKLIVGLGNPGARYAGTRHNAGFLVLDALARRWAVAFRSGRQAEEASARGVQLLKPTTFMNLSGAAVQAALTRARVQPSDMLVVHDDIDLPLGRVRLRRGGGAGGQKGVRDIIDRVGSDFDRLKVGVSRPPEGWSTENWVLSRFSDSEQETLKQSVDKAADAIERLLESDWDATVRWLHAPAPTVASGESGADASTAAVDDRDQAS